MMADGSEDDRDGPQELLTCGRGPTPAKRQSKTKRAKILKNVEAKLHAVQKKGLCLKIVAEKC